MRKLLLFLGFILLWNAGFATHQRAGEITYEHQSGLTYKFTIITYTYTPSPADRPEIEVFWGDNSSSTIQRLSKISVAPDISKNTYVATHTFSSSGIFSVTFEDPNRNAGIINIPNSVNIPFFIETIVVINPFLGYNNSVQLLNPPLDNGCVGVTYYHNVGAYDPDGDSLSYKLVDCRGMDGLPIPGYRLPQASQYITIDEITGDLIWETPIIQGEYNVAILISEYRRGQFIGSIVRDLQITISACNNRPPQILCNDTCVVSGNLILLDITVKDTISTQVTLTATGAPFMTATSPAIPVNVSGKPTLETNFIWQTVCEHIKKSPYQIVLKATDNGPQVNLTAFKTVNIKVIAPAPQNLTSFPILNSIILRWDNYCCLNATEIHIYRKTDSSHFEPDFCETGIPYSERFQLLAKTNASNTEYVDNGSVTPLTHGREYCYRIIAVFSDGAESIVSNETCAAIVTDAPMISKVDVMQTSESNGEIAVAWIPPPEIDTTIFPGPNFEYKIFRSPNDKNNFKYVASTFSLRDTSFIDKSLNTKEIQYFYQIEFWGENKSGDRVHIENSDPASSIFLKIEETDKKLKLSWNEDVPWKNIDYIIYRSDENSQQFDSINTTEYNFYDDIEVYNGINYCYYVKSVGQYTIPDTVMPLYNRSQKRCGVPVDNIPPNMPDTTYITTDCENVTFWWVFPDSVSYLDAYQYYIYYQPNYQTPFSCIDSFLFSNVDSCWPSSCPCYYIIQNLPSAIGCYAMIIKDEAGNCTEMTPKHCIDIDQCRTYSLPNVFTPDGDGINDTWVPFDGTNINVKKIDLEVHDRWGKRVFKTENPDINWDGKDEKTGRDLPEGTYYYGCDVYLFSLEGIKKRFLSGIVMILRGGGSNQNY